MSNVMKKCAAVLLAVVMMVAFMPMLNGQTFAASKPGKVNWSKSAVKQSGNSLYLKWNNPKNAQKYEIYMKKGKKGKWYRKTTVSKTYYKKYLKTHKNGYRIGSLSWKTWYAVKVRAVNGKKKGAFSRIYAGTLPSKKTLKNMTGWISDKYSMQKEMQDSFMDGDHRVATVTVTESGNTAILKIAATDASYSAYGDQDSFTAGMKETFGASSAATKELKKTIPTMEYTYGIATIKWQVVGTYNGTKVYSINIKK